MTCATAAPRRTSTRVCRSRSIKDATNTASAWTPPAALFPATTITRHSYAFSPTARRRGWARAIPAPAIEMFKKPISTKATQFTESVIREMTRLALQHGAVNLSQGFPDFAAPEILKKAASDAIFADVNQYAITWGAPKFRNAIAEKTKAHLGIAR